MSVTAKMKQVGEMPDGSPLFYADEHFEQPGFYVWDSEAGNNVRMEFVRAGQEPTTTPQERVDPLKQAHACIEQIGGVRENGSAELAPIAIAEALIAIAQELQGIREALESEAIGERIESALNSALEIWFQRTGGERVA